MFTNSVYLQANHTICCLGTSYLVNGPINIQSDLPALCGLNTGDPWVVANRALTLGNQYRLSTENSTCWNRSKKNIAVNKNQRELHNISVCVDIIEQVLSYHSAHIISSDFDNTTDKVVKEQLRRYSSLLTKTLQQPITFSNETAIPVELAGMIGCGDGLTPAGDDILVGALTALHFFNSNRFIKLREWVLLQAPNNTNTISLAHLTAACDGLAVELVHDVLEATNVTHQLDNYKKKLVSASAMKLANYGHSSGYFALSGILLVLKSIAID